MAAHQNQSRRDLSPSYSSPGVTRLNSAPSVTAQSGILVARPSSQGPESLSSTSRRRVRLLEMFCSSM